MNALSAPKYANWPIIGPLLILLSSQELILAFLAMGIDYLIWMRPELEEVRLPLMAIFTTLIGLILTGKIAARLDGFTTRGFWMAVFRPFRLLLQSRKFWTAVGTLIANVIVSLIPELEEIQVELMTLITTVGLGLMGTIAWEDSAAKKDVTPPAVEKDAPGMPDLKGDHFVGMTGYGSERADVPQPPVTVEIQRLSDDETIRLTKLIVAALSSQFVFHPK
jgi:hypothetical protein